jgi:hypothetical protein
MLTLTDADVRRSFVNASRKEVSSLTLPASFAETPWDDLDYFGWRDAKFAKRAYVLLPATGGRIAGVLLREADERLGARAQCSWCRDVTLPNEVVFYAARRTGPAGRQGDTVGTLVCRDFECSANVRRLPPLAYEGFDREAARQRRIDDLRELVATFADSL